MIYGLQTFGSSAGDSIHTYSYANASFSELLGSNNYGDGLGSDDKVVMDLAMLIDTVEMGLAMAIDKAVMDMAMAMAVMD